MDDEHGPLCMCGYEMAWEDCYDCGGDGCFDVDDDLEAFDDFEPCSTCGGFGVCVVCVMVGTAHHVAAMERLTSAKGD